MTKQSLYVIGDSISMGYGPFLEKMIAESFTYRRKSGEEEALKNLDVPCGANGGDSSMVLEFLQALQTSQAFHTDVLLLNCGLHDIKSDKETGRPEVDHGLG